jgi:NAD(P)H-dependent flavin oxidoreductase YrpB (nitropropane dioxygenase family)
LRNALTFRKETGTSLRELVAEGLAMRKTQDLSWSELAMAANAPMMTKAALVDGHPEMGILPSGQNAGVIGELPTVAELLARIVEEAESTLKRLGV